MKILIFNWRDVKNPSSGGAEILTHEIAKRWVDSGNQVTLFTSQFDRGASGEIIDGVEIIRRGNPDARHLLNSVHYLAFKEYNRNFKGKFDVVIDEIHGLPFFTPWYVKEKKVALICEVAGELWTKMFIFAFGLMGRVTELIALRVIYRNVPFLTISQSTKEELIKNGVKNEKINVLPMGINIPIGIKTTEKEKRPTLIFVGRLTSLKGVEDAIVATKIVKETYQNIRLWILGRGKDQFVTRLKELCKELDIEQNVTFCGFVSDNKKFELLAKAHILISPSAKEGFGLTIPEAGFVGTPAVVYRSLGLTEIVIHNKTGLVCNENTPEELANNCKELIKNKILYKKLQGEAIKLSKNYSWDYSAKISLELLKQG